MKGPKAPSKKYSAKSQQPNLNPKYKSRRQQKPFNPVPSLFTKSRGGRPLLRNTVQGTTTRPKPKIQVKTPTETFQAREKSI